ncbi:unnamed protein product [Closterium sp. NIES-54]
MRSAQCVWSRVQAYQGGWLPERLLGVQLCATATAAGGRGGGGGGVAAAAAAAAESTVASAVRAAAAGPAAAGVLERRLQEPSIVSAVLNPARQDRFCSLEHSWHHGDGDALRQHPRHCPRLQPTTFHHAHHQYSSQQADSLDHMNGMTQRQRQHHNYHSLAAPATATTIHHAHYQYHSQRASFLDHIIGDTQKRQRHEDHSVAAPTTLTAAGAVAAAGTAAAAAARMHAPVTVFESTQNPPPHHPSPPPPPPPREPAPVLAPPTPQMTFESTQKSPSSQEPPREPSPAPAPPPTPQIAMAAAGMGAPVTVFAANFGSLKPRVLLIDGTCYASHAVVQRIAKADRDQKISFCCAQSEAAHPYLAAFGLTSSDVLHSLVYIQGFNASFTGTSGRCLLSCVSASSAASISFSPSARLRASLRCTSRSMGRLPTQDVALQSLGTSGMP